MGIFRLVLAISVVYAHSDFGIRIVGGQIAVQLFYIVSGFYISFILVEDNRYLSTRNFYIARYLRLYPIYAVVAVLSFVLYYFAREEFFNVYKNAPAPIIIQLILSNLSLFGQDLVYFTTVSNGVIVFPEIYRFTDVRVWEGLLVQQSGVLGVEIWFYLIAPFIVRSKKLIFPIMFLSLYLRFYMHTHGVDMMAIPWSYVFFPTEIILFMMGVVGHQIILPIYEKLFSAKQINIMWSR